LRAPKLPIGIKYSSIGIITMGLTSSREQKHESNRERRERKIAYRVLNKPTNWDVCDHDHQSYGFLSLTGKITLIVPKYWYLWSQIYN
jgi:hypothetical protein